MKVTKEKSAANRAALVRSASRLFRERGIDGVGVAEISKDAKLTHGALYAQFRSKGALVAEALGDAVRRSCSALTAVPESNGSRVGDYLDFLLSPAQRDNVARGCPLTALTSEIGRQDASVSAKFVEGFEAMAATVEAALGESDSTGASARQRALAIVAAEIGAIAVARATAKANPALSRETLGAMRNVLGLVAGEHMTTQKKPRGRPERRASQS